LRLSQESYNKDELNIINMEKRMKELTEREMKRKKDEASPTPKITEDALCHDGFNSKTIINKTKEEKAPEEKLLVEENINNLEDQIHYFVTLKDYAEMAKYLFQHPELVSDQVDIVLITNAHAWYQERDIDQSYEYLRHSLVIRYILKLSDGKTILPMLTMFFDKILDKIDNHYREGFEADLRAFFDYLKSLPSLQ
jgi:hypothetical protein